MTASILIRLGSELYSLEKEIKPIYMVGDLFQESGIRDTVVSIENDVLKVLSVIQVNLSGYDFLVNKHDWTAEKIQL